MFGSTNDLFGMLLIEDKLDETNYLMWAYSMKHVLVAKKLWLYVCGDEKRPPNVVTFGSSSQVGGNQVLFRELLFAGSVPTECGMWHHQPW